MYVEQKKKPYLEGKRDYEKIAQDIHTQPHVQSSAAKVAFE